MASENCKGFVMHTHRALTAMPAQGADRSSHSGPSVVVCAIKAHHHGCTGQEGNKNSGQPEHKPRPGTPSRDEEEEAIEIRPCRSLSAAPQSRPLPGNHR
ncbi:hypothetical protein MN608_01452 [Microdochium nivale]|nr:hypothetical protein MN608_01452 [Microdochium nivale]